MSEIREVNSVVGNAESFLHLLYTTQYAKLIKAAYRMIGDMESAQDLIADLKNQYTIVIVTHNMQQATRISDKCAFFLLGELIEYGDTEQMFSVPKDQRTEDYITGRFG